MNAAQSTNTPTDPEQGNGPTSIPAPPLSIVRPATTTEAPRDTRVDPPKRSRLVAFFLGVVSVLLFAPRLLARLVMREVNAFLVRFQDPPIAEFLPDPPPPLREAGFVLEGDELAERIAHELFRVPPNRLAGLFQIAALLYTTRRDGIDARRDLRVLFTLSRIVDNLLSEVPIGLLRQQLRDIYRHDLNASLERLANEKWLVLLDKKTDNAAHVLNGFRVKSGATVTHVRLLRWL